MHTSSTHRNPSWWKDEHTSSWERAKAALRRDWEQTKADFTDGGTELNQDVGDTVKQASGKQRIPGANVPNPPDSWDEAEPALRYGYGARHHYSGREWDDELEQKLKTDWDSTGQGNSWERVKAAVRRGWESVKRVAA